MYLFFRLTCEPEHYQFSSIYYLSNRRAQVSVLLRALYILYDYVNQTGIDKTRQKNFLFLVFNTK